MDPITVGVVGYSRLQNDQRRQAQQFLKDALTDIDEQFPDQVKIFISGLTYSGVPGLASDIVDELKAQGRSWKKLGIACQRAKRMRCYDVDEALYIGQKWGDESAEFINRVQHFLVRVGGGLQARHETDELRKKAVTIIELELPIKEALKKTWKDKRNSRFS